MTPRALLVYTWIGGLAAVCAVFGISWWYRWHALRGARELAAKAKTYRQIVQEADAKLAAEYAATAKPFCGGLDWTLVKPLESRYQQGEPVLWGTTRATVEEVSIDGATVLLCTDTGSYEWVRTKDITRIMRAA